MNVSHIQKDAKDFGLPAVLHAMACGAINRAIFFRVLQCMHLSAVNPAYLKIDPRFQHRFLDEATIRRFGKDELYDIPESFIDEALAKGDECYGILDGDVLASCGWYARKPTEIADKVLFRFGQRYIYMYKGFTHPDYRGQRLHAIGMNWALKRYQEQQLAGLVSYVYSNNFDSLRSVYRVGYQDIGRIHIARIFNSSWVHIDRGCRQFGVSVEVLEAHSSSYAAAKQL